MTRLRSQVHQDTVQTSINLEQDATDPPEDWRAKFVEAERRYEELIWQNDSSVQELKQQILTLSQDRDAYKQELESMSATLENFKVQSELERLRIIEQLRKSYEGRLADERAQVARERQRADAWIQDLKDSTEMEKRSYHERIRRLEAELAQKAKRVTIDESVGGADGTSMHCDATSDRADNNLCVTTPGGDGSSVSLHGETNSYVATSTCGRVMSEYGSCSAGGQPFSTYYSSPTQLAVARGPLITYSRCFSFVYAKVTLGYYKLWEHSRCTSP